MVHIPTRPSGRCSKGASQIKIATVVLGVQYHPEHDLTFSASLMQARADALVGEGLVRDVAAAHTVAADFHALHQGSRPDLAWRYGIDDQVLDPRCRTADIGQWLKLAVREEGR
jgi:GMP synthase (glutamine-hydrolysing)